MLNSTATIGWLTTAHWKGHATSSPSLCWIVFNIFPLNRFSPLLTESALGVDYVGFQRAILCLYITSIPTKFQVRSPPCFKKQGFRPQGVFL